MTCLSFIWLTADRFLEEKKTSVLNKALILRFLRSLITNLVSIFFFDSPLGVGIKRESKSLIAENSCISMRSVSVRWICYPDMTYKLTRLMMDHITINDG